jgi:hypothetical protein
MSAASLTAEDDIPRPAIAQRGWASFDSTRTPRDIQHASHLRIAGDQAEVNLRSPDWRTWLMRWLD